MLRWLTAGESHGPALVGIIEGVPAGVELTSAQIADALARRRLGYGRGARMKFEQDVVDDPRRRPPRPHPGRPRRHPGRQHRMAQVGADHVRRPRRPGDPRRAGPQRPADPPPARPRRLHRHAEVRLRRGASRARTRQRPRDCDPRGPRHRRLRVPRSSSASSSCPTQCPSPAPPSRKAGRCRSRTTSWPSTPTRCAASTAKPPTPWSPRSTSHTRRATPSAASSRSSPTASRRDWAATSTGTAASTPVWPLP